MQITTVQRNNRCFSGVLVGLFSSRPFAAKVSAFCSLLNMEVRPGHQHVIETSSYWPVSSYSKQNTLNMRHWIFSSFINQCEK